MALWPALPRRALADVLTLSVPEVHTVGEREKEAEGEARNVGEVERGGLAVEEGLGV